MPSTRTLSQSYEVKDLQDLVRALNISRASNNRALITVKASLVNFWGHENLKKMIELATKTAKWKHFILRIDPEQNNALGHLAIHSPYVSEIVFSNPPEPIQKLASEHNISIIQP